jgi:hypothetical protein
VTTSRPSEEIAANWFKFGIPRLLAWTRRREDEAANWFGIPTCGHCVIVDVELRSKGRMMFNPFPPGGKLVRHSSCPVFFDPLIL